MSIKFYQHEHQIPFQDTDMAGVVHYTKVLGYVELAEHVFLMKLGIDPISDKGGFPKVSVQCDYKYPLRFQDEVSIEVSLTKISTKSLQWEFSMMSNEVTTAVGEFVTAYVDGSGRATEIPERIISLLAE